MKTGEIVEILDNLKVKYVNYDNFNRLKLQLLIFDC